MFDQKGRFIIENYNQKPPFSSFLPGISGIKGIPIWCFYVNRGQAIASFGTEDKDHSILEFYPAHQAYQLTKTMGFRTYIKIDGNFYEPFSGSNKETRMYIGMNEVEIEEKNETLGLQVNVKYYTLPGEVVGGLVRMVHILNLREEERDIEILDGLPAIIPYGIELKSLKEMAQTMKAWMQVEDVETKTPYYRVRYSTKDSAAISKVNEGNFMLGMADESFLDIIADPELIYGYDTTYQEPIHFLEKGITKLLEENQILQNKVPCGFCALKKNLKGKSSVQIYEVIGSARKKQERDAFVAKCKSSCYFENQSQESVFLTEELGKQIGCKTNHPVFDSYCKQTYIDNVLRGGTPIVLGKDKVFYVYGRKHGDIERDYNFFKMTPEFYSQGNGNFRDVNQNRRSDILYHPNILDYNIKIFYNLIQVDGYNPLVLEQATYKIEESTQKEVVLRDIKNEYKDDMCTFFEKPFTPGQLSAFLEEHKIYDYLEKEAVMEKVFSYSTPQLNAQFHEGYWSDHWTYNLDLIETYLSVYPEKKEVLLWEDKSYVYFESKAVVLPRKKRYVKTELGIRQYNALDEITKKNVKHSWVKTNYGQGEIYHSNLMTKMILLFALKFATLDGEGMGIEMEGGKPGWYDALNGLPGIFGSSMAETYELKRFIFFLMESVKAQEREVVLPTEGYHLLWKIKNIVDCYYAQKKTTFWVWDELNNEKEIYRERTMFGFDGAQLVVDSKNMLTILEGCLQYVEDGIKRAFQLQGGFCPTYFTYEVLEYSEDEEGILPTKMRPIVCPIFLEGPVRYLKLDLTQKQRMEIYEQVMKSDLYDAKLKMYKVNASLEAASFEVGRAKAFTPGWLENESIWLHMEYKYLLQLLKGQLYEIFFKELKNTCIGFQDYEQYGRSPLENVSFIVSSANTNEALHGKGFVARLSGSTAEFLQIWQIMMFGSQPFQDRQGKVCCQFAPILPDYLIPENGCVHTTFLGHIPFVYFFGRKRNIIPGEYKITKIQVTFPSGEQAAFENVIPTEIAVRIRSEKVERIEAFVS